MKMTQENDHPINGEILIKITT